MAKIYAYQCGKCRLHSLRRATLLVVACCVGLGPYTGALAASDVVPVYVEPLKKLIADSMIAACAVGMAEAKGKPASSSKVYLDRCLEILKKEQVMSFNVMQRLSAVTAPH